jgi:hypothetical protein
MKRKALTLYSTSQHGGHAACLTAIHLDVSQEGCGVHLEKCGDGWSAEVMQRCIKNDHKRKNPEAQTGLCTGFLRVDADHRKLVVYVMQEPM